MKTPAWKAHILERRKAREIVRRVKPPKIVGVPMCGPLTVITRDWLAGDKIVATGSSVTFTEDMKDNPLRFRSRAERL